MKNMSLIFVLQFSDPAKPTAAAGSDKEVPKGQETPSFRHSEGSQKDERRRLKSIRVFQKVPKVFYNSFINIHVHND